MNVDQMPGPFYVVVWWSPNARRHYRSAPYLKLTTAERYRDTELGLVQEAQIWKLGGDWERVA